MAQSVIGQKVNLLIKFIFGYIPMRKIEPYCRRLPKVLSARNVFRPVQLEPETQTHYVLRLKALASLFDVYFPKKVKTRKSGEVT